MKEIQYNTDSVFISVDTEEEYAELLQLLEKNGKIIDNIIDKYVYLYKIEQLNKINPQENNKEISLYQSKIKEIDKINAKEIVKKDIDEIKILNFCLETKKEKIKIEIDGIFLDNRLSKETFNQRILNKGLALSAIEDMQENLKMDYPNAFERKYIYNNNGVPEFDEITEDEDEYYYDDEIEY